MLVRGLSAQKHRVERAAGHILINERELILRIEIHTVPRAAHEKARALLRGKVRQQPVPQRRLDVAERCDAHAHQLQFLLVREHRVRLFAVWHDGDVHAVKELRRALERVGAQLHFHLLSTESAASIEQSAVNATVQACEIMSRERVGVLLVFERETPLDEYFKTGTIVDAQLSEQLLRNLFFTKASLHDGAVIIRHGRILGAGCMLPLSKNVNLSRDLGMRHRAGIGMSENSDAVVVIVSEETGSISVAIGGMLKRHLMPETLSKLLRNELMPQPEELEDKPRRSLADLLGLRRKEGDNGAEE